MKKYVLGFAFNAAKDWVVLIEKTKPEWQKGSFNGVGGKIEEGELPPEAMVREFREETGVETRVSDWEKVGVMQGPDWVCHVFESSPEEVMHVETTTEEEVGVFYVRDVLNGELNTISNVPFLIELCRDPKRPAHTILQYD
jgi:8-oxo-dGTP diphosphatase